MGFLHFRILFILLISAQSVVAGPKLKNEPILHHLNGELTDAMTFDGFSPPMASRVYFICNVGFYEVIQQQSEDYLSLAGQINGFTGIPNATKEVHLLYAASLVFQQLGERLVYTNQGFARAVDSHMNQNIRDLNDVTRKASIHYAQEVVGDLMRWVGNDGYRKMRTMPAYHLLKGESFWEPTPPAYHDALESNWYHLRPATLDSVSQFAPKPPVAFSDQPKSPFYQEAYNVYETVNNLTDSERMIAKFWDCNPLQTKVEGHMKIKAKQMTPGGHWMAICGIACETAGITEIVEVSCIYTSVAIGLYDGFLISWQCKYAHNLIRPETYINRYIDANWRPILETPPFPEYTSAHSVISMTTGQILEHLVGEITYLDTVETQWGYPVRTFSSFVRAALEVSQSRVYGGIHYNMGVEMGIWQGKRLGRHILKRIRFKQ
jgi:hypothetical protein